MKKYVALALIPQVIVTSLLSEYPQFVETFYSTGVYPYLATLSRYVFGWVPFSVGDIMYLIGIVLIVRWLLLNRKHLLNNSLEWLTDVVATLSVVYFAFHIFWAFNYYRLPLHKNLNLEASYTTEALLEVTNKLITISNNLHKELEPNDSLMVVLPYSKTDIFNLAPEGYKALQNQFPNLAYKPTSVKMSLFSLPLTYMGFSGYLNPLTNEAQVDKLIPVYKFPTTVSHEIAHQLGYAAENEANFIGSLAAMSHPDPYFKYCGYTFALRHCLYEIYRRDPETYNTLLPNIRTGILKNYQEVQDFWRSYQNPLEPLFKTTYNSFLKANNQQGGMKSYSYVVALYVNYFLES
ncbi:DUF3810 domain-containing protein [Bizionia sediminis]|uniref:DUF3810 domain-containing protein n=1 Tax=Bizionia sediminis TaxID=1737064 RepID=A0ABW5KRS8_9FLAO